MSALLGFVSKKSGVAGAAWRKTCWGSLLAPEARVGGGLLAPITIVGVAYWLQKDVWGRLICARNKCWVAYWGTSVGVARVAAW